MKPFNLKSALAGAPVVTRHGVSVTQIRLLDRPSCGQTVGGHDGATHETWYADGRYFIERDECSLDLFMDEVGAPKKKLTYWINFYEDGLAYGYPTREEANTASDRARIGKARKVVLEVAE